MAYCLMGLFDVNMPLLYGEGSKAFYRLQLEIIKSSTDESIFAWELQDSGADLGGPRALPLFATEPAMFQHAGNIQDHRFVNHLSPYTMTNKGLHIQAELAPACEFTKASKSEKLLLLNCYRAHDDLATFPAKAAIFLNQVDKGSGTFVRCRKQLFLVDEKLSDDHGLNLFRTSTDKLTQIYIKNNSTRIDSGKNESNTTPFLLDLRSALKAGFEITSAITKQQYKDDRTRCTNWEGDFQIFRFPDPARLEVDCEKPNEMFCITISTSQWPLGLSIQIYQRQGPEGKYLKLRSDSLLPSGRL
jgi:hypothetical protein